MLIERKAEEPCLSCELPSQRSTNNATTPDTPCLIVILISFIIHDVVEAEFVDTLGGGDNTEPIAELLLLEVATRELLVSNDLNLAFARLADGDCVPEIASAAIHLDAIVKELLEC